jgi:hypothetical protein
MPSCSRSERHLPFLSDLSTKDRQLAARAITVQDERRSKANDARGKKAEALMEGFQRQVHGLLGARNFAELRDGIAREREAFRDLWDPPQGLKRDYVKQRKASKRSVDALLRRLGVNRSKLAKINRDFDQKLSAVLTATDAKVVPGFNLSKNLAKWTKLSPLHSLPLPWGISPGLEFEREGWTLFRPPFFGFLFDTNLFTSSNFRADHQLILSPPAGHVGNVVTLDCDDAGEFDAAHAIGESQIAFRFDAPTTGLVEVLIDAQSIFGSHHVRIEDEFGFSNAWSNQHNSLMMNVLHPSVPEPSFAGMSNIFVESDGDDVNVTQGNLTRGRHFFAQLFSSGPVQAGESVIVTVGTRTFDMGRANDMELHSRMHFEWFINSVEVRISP